MTRNFANVLGQLLCLRLRKGVVRLLQRSRARSCQPLDDPGKSDTIRLRPSQNFATTFITPSEASIRLSTTQNRPLASFIMGRGREPLRDDPRSRSHRHDNRHVPENGTTPQRCEDQSYIQSWLIGVKGDNENGREDFDEEQQWRPHNLTVPQKRSFPDEATARKKSSRVPKDSPLRRSTKYRDDLSSHHGASAAPPSSSSGKENVYAKKARKKTREDRYDTKKCKPKPEKRRESLQRPHRRKDRKRELRSGKEVMHNFNSNAISNDRVTASLAFQGSEAVVTKIR